MPSSPLVTTSLPNLPRFRTGKVRDVYDLGDSLLIVATDRISAFDYILGTGIPDKGKRPDAAVGLLVRAPGARRSQPLRYAWTSTRSRPPRARTATSCAAGRCWCGRPRRSTSNAWRAGTSRGRAGRNTARPARVCGIALPAGLRESDRLPHPIFTPATKAAIGPRHQHRRGRSDAHARRIRRCSPRCATRRSSCIARPARTPRPAGSCWPTRNSSSASTATRLLLIDEALTPDSSRFWPADQYAPGGPQPELRQAVRARLSRGDHVEQAAARARAARRRRRPAPARNTSKRSSG